MGAGTPIAERFFIVMNAVRLWIGVMKKMSEYESSKEQILQEMALELSQKSLSNAKELEIFLSAFFLNFDIIPKSKALIKIDNFDETYINRFIVCKKIEGLSEKTLRYYHSEITRFLTFIIGLSVHIQDVTTDVVRAYIAYGLTNKKWSYANADNVRRIISTFYTWAVNDDIVVKNPVAKIKPMKQRKNVRTPFTNTEIEKMRDYITKNGNERDRAIFECLLSTGCRVSELCSLKIQDVNFYEKEAKVLGKGSKERMVYFNDTSIFYLKKYLEICPAELHKNDILFVSELVSSKNGLYNGLGISGCEIWIRKMGNNLGIKAHPHKFRHTAATMALSRGMPIEQVRQMLGHEKIETTLIYAHSDTKTLKQTHQKLM